MPFRQTPDTHTPYAIVAYDKNGSERNDDPDGANGLMSVRLLSEVQQSRPTDIFFFSHGWMGDMGAAADQYNRWIDAMARLTSDSGQMGDHFRPLWVGLHWPSLPWGDEELGAGGAFAAAAGIAAAPPPANLLETYLDRINLNSSLHARELLGVIFRENRVNAAAAALPQNVADAYTELSQLVGYESKGIGADPGSDNAPFNPEAAFQAMNSAGVAFGGGFVGGLLGPLRGLSFWTMKKRARSNGEGNMFQLVAQLQQALPECRTHLMGHSFGCIVMSSICGGPNGTTPLPRPVDSLALAQGALSLWAYADAIPSTGGRGYFNSMIHRPAVKGPIVTTRSAHDTAVNVWYPAAVSLVLQDPSFALNPSLIRWGAIGAFGIQGVNGSVDTAMLPQTGDYHMQPGVIYNLESSQFIRKMVGVSGAHCDIDGVEVAHAIWSAAIASVQTAGIVAVRAAAGLSGGAAAAPAIQQPDPAVVTADAALAVEPVAGMPAAVLEKPLPVGDAEMPIPFGVQAETGAYLPALAPSDLRHVDQGSHLVAVRNANAGAAHLAVEVDVDPRDLSKAGWGIVFSADMDEAKKAEIQAALKPLLDLRQKQAGKLYKVFDKATGYRKGLRAEQWLTEQGSGLAMVDPSQGVPYYLLLAGSPDDIPFEFQYDLDIFFAVGRLYFQTADEYGTYAKNMVAYESEPPAHGNTIAFYNTRNDGDRATGLLHDQIALPLIQGNTNMNPLGANQGYTITARLADRATKAELLNILRGKTEAGNPAMLFTGSHGVSFSKADANQSAKQGAILTQNWGGPGTPVSPDTYFTSNEVPQDAAVKGTIHFFFACYSAGCPQFDTYSYDPADRPVQIANATIVARLPQQMLLRGAQAVIGHIDRAWAYSFQNTTGAALAQVFRDPMTRILRGDRIGDALDVFDQRWTALSSQLLTDVRNRAAVPGSVPDPQLANRWVARDDARNYIVIGDPAARLRTEAVQPSRAAAGATSGARDGAAAAGSAIPGGFDVAAAPDGAAAAPAAVPVGAAMASSTHLDRRPTLHFKDFTGKLRMNGAVSPDASFQLMQNAFATAAAGSKVDAYVYAISAPHMINLLKLAQDRGATIRVMYDPDQMAAANVQKLKQLGFNVRVAPSHDPRRVFTVCHQKFVVIDRKLVVVGSANWAASSIPDREAGQKRQIGNREWLLQVNEEKVARWYGDLFDADWNIPAIEDFGIGAQEVPLVPAAVVRAPRFAAPRDFPVMTFSGQQSTLTPLTSPDNYFESVLPLIRSAQRRIWIQQQYIEGGGGPSVPRLLDVVAQRKAAGVDVRLIISSRFPDAWDASKQTIRDAGLTSRLRAINLDNFTHCHNKGVIVDDAVVISSTNWSENSIRSAREAGALIHSATVAGFYGQVFDDDWQTGWSIATADSQARSFAVVAAGDEAVDVDPADRV